jgi:putative ABC transport system substrate-binding protein
MSTYVTVKEDNMKGNMVFKTLIMTFVLLVISAAPSWARKNVDVAMVLWRGMTEAEKGFQSQLNESERYNFNFTVFDANQDKNELNRIIDQLDATKYQIIYSFGTTVTKTLKSKVKDIPIVFNIVSRPVKAKIIESWEHSGCNVTGASNAVPMASAFNTLSKVMRIGRLGFMYNPKEANSIIQRDEVDTLQDKFSYEMVDAPIADIGEIDAVIEKLVNEKVDAVLLPSDSLVKASADKIIPSLNARNIPTIVSIPDMVRDNKAFIGLGPDYVELGKMAAYKALAILGGKEPNEVPTSTLKRLHMTVNLSTAKEIGVNVPVQILRISTVVK